MERREAKEIEQKKKMNKRKRSREEEILETALAATGVALFVSCLKRFLQCSFHQWPCFFHLAPSPLLFLLLHLVVASIVLISTRPRVLAHRDDRRRSGHEKRSQARRKKRTLCSASTVKEEEKKSFVGNGEEQEEGDADELNARVEAFIASFRQQLRVDSFSHRIPRTGEGASFVCSDGGGN